MLESLAQLLKLQTRLLRLEIPYDRGEVLAAAHRVGEVIAEKHDGDGTVVEVRVPLEQEGRFTDFLA